MPFKIKNILKKVVAPGLLVICVFIIFVKVYRELIIINLIFPNSKYNILIREENKYMYLLNEENEKK